MTRFLLDGADVDAPGFFVVGEVEAVEPVTGLRSPDPAEPVNEPVGDNIVAFDSPEALVDIVGIRLSVVDGVAEANEPLPDELVITLNLPAPTDVTSLSQELQSIGVLGAIVFRNPSLDKEVAPSFGAPLYEVLDGFFLGPVDDGSVTFGALLPTDEFHHEHEASVDDIIDGAGVLEVMMIEGEVVRSIDTVRTTGED